VFEQVTLTADGSEVQTCCADLKNDVANCGVCDLACNDGESCVDGQCLLP
jgi:hypothetical protein